MAGITSSGLGSGLDINSLVTQLVAAEQKPTLDRLNTKEAQLQAKFSAIGTVKATFSDFRTSLSALRTAGNLDKISATSSNSDVFSATATNTAKSNTYAIEVKQLAAVDIKSSQGFSGADAVPIPGGTTLTIGTGSTSKSITVNGTDKLSDIMAAINDADAGVTASIVNAGGTNGYHLVLKSKASGTSNAITLNDSSSTLIFDTKQSAADAIVSIDGIDVTSASNTLTGAIDGVTLNLSQAKSGTPLSLKISPDSTNFSTAIKNMTDKFNALVDAVANVASYNPDTKQAGPLLSDGGVRMAIGQLRNILDTRVEGLNGAVKTLQDLGVSTGSAGHLSFNSAKFNAAYFVHKSDAITLFTDKTGLVARFDKALAGILDTDGMLTARSNGLQKSLAQIGKDRTALSERLAAYQAQLVTKFNAMDQVVGRMNSTSNWMTQQFNALFNTSKSKS